MSCWQVRPIGEADWEHVARIQAAAYPGDFLEAPEVLRSKQAQGASQCLLMWRDDEPLAYVLAHPWAGDALPALHRAAHPHTAPAYCFLHDLAVDPQGHGSGAGRRLWQALLEQLPADWPVRLIALPQAVGFWQRCGFEIDTAYRPGDEYGAGSVAMVRHAV